MHCIRLNHAVKEHTPNKHSQSSYNLYDKFISLLLSYVHQHFCLVIMGNDGYLQVSV